LSRSVRCRSGDGGCVGGSCIGSVIGRSCFEFHWGGGVGDAGFVVGVDGGESAELETVDEGEDSGAAGREVSSSKKLIKGAERVVDALCGLNGRSQLS